MDTLFSVKGKTVLITGGSRGIGAMMARGFCQAGARVYICSRKREELQHTAEILSKEGECIALPADLSNRQGISALGDQLLSQEDSLDVLINNAGATWGAPIDDFPEQGWDKIMDINVKAMFFLTQKLLPALRKAANVEDPARIINIASINALRHSRMENYSYSASKAAVITLTEHLAAQLAKDKITANAISPGFFPSKMTAFLMANDEAEAQIAGMIPLKRIGTPEDAAGTAIFLASRAGAFVTGANIVLDGGTVANAG